MARKLTGLQRVLDVPSLAAVAYGEIASSLYFALGVVALYALGLTPWVLLGVGLLFVLVALSYAEGTAALPETGGAATFVRRGFNDPAGFATGWVLFLDYLIVIALAALFVPHYLAQASGWEVLTDRPWDVVAGIGVVLAVAGVRLIRRPGLYRLAIALAAVAFTTHVLLIGLGFAFLFSTDALSLGTDVGTAPKWDSLAFSLPLAMLAYTGLETVANLAADTREPGRTLPRSLFVGIGGVVAVSVAVAIVGICAYPARTAGGPDGVTSELGSVWVRAPLAGLAAAFDGQLPAAAADALRIFVGVTGALVLAAAVTTSISGAGRLAYSLARHDMLPHAFGRLSRRTVIPPASIVAAAAIASVLLVLSEVLGRGVRFLAGVYSFGVLLAFAAAQLAVIRLRFRAPELERPFRVPGNVRLGRADVPLPALIGTPLTLAVFAATLATHQRALVAGSIWLALGAILYIAVRRAHDEPLLGAVQPAEGQLVPEPEGVYRHILVPQKLGPIADDVLGTAIKLAEESGVVEVLHVVQVPLDVPPDSPLPEKEARARQSIDAAKKLASERGVAVEGKIVRHPNLGAAIVDAAVASRADLIVMGSSPRWRRWSQFVSPTVDVVLRRAPCEVMVVAYPDGYLDEDGEGP
ncbi:MAG: amino acid permease [Actinomycetota bacterium]|nr:amino acid permease [Actinomycetota bacterium]